MRKIIICLQIFLLVSFSNQLFAQADLVTVENKTLTLRWNPLGVLAIWDQNLSFGFEKKFSGQWSYGADIAYIFYSDYLSKSKRSNGYMIRSFVRYYFKENKRDFIETELQYKRMAYEISDWIGKDVVNGIPAYEEFEMFDYIKHVYGIHMKVGTQTKLSADERWRVEWYAGLGYRWKNQGPKEGQYQRRTGLGLQIYDPKFSSVVFLMGCRLLFDLNKN